MASSSNVKFDFLSLLRGLVCVGLVSSLTSAPALAEPRTYTDLESCVDALAVSSAVKPATGLEGITIVSWNAMKFSRDGADKYLQELTQAADFVFLQESRKDVAQTATATASAIAGTRLERYFAAGYTSKEWISGVEVRSSHPADVLCKLSYLEPLLRTPKAVLVARIPFEDMTLLLINVHAINFTITTSAYRSQLASLTRLLNAHSGAAIVGGDLNTWNRWRTAALEEFSKSSQLQEVRFEPDRRSEHFGSKVDTFLIRGLLASASKALPTEASDHHGIKTRLSPAPRVDSHAATASPAPER
ncbi:MAG: endonuclease/exonuclease/phosphatase family protein [Pseudomonadota bacterium]